MDHPSPGQSDAALLTADASVETERAGRYLSQLCRHVEHMARMRLGMRARVERSDDRAVIDFGWGRCTLRAEPGVLILHAQAHDEDSVRRIEHGVAERLERIGRRDRLTVSWSHD